MSRGNARQKIFRDERDYGRFWKGWEATIDKFRFELFGSVCMPNHVHLFFRTPEPKLSRGMQYLLSGYANWFSTRGIGGELGELGSTPVGELGSTPDT